MAVGISCDQEDSYSDRKRRTGVEGSEAEDEARNWSFLAASSGPRTQNPGKLGLGALLSSPAPGFRGNLAT